MPVSYTQAWIEAAAAADKSEVMLPAVELIHPEFVENGQAAPIRAVRNTVDLMLRLEQEAPLHGGLLVPFKGILFDVDYPRIGKFGAEATLRLDNVNREAMPYLEAAAKSNEPIKVIFRGYLASDPDTVGQGPYHLFLRRVRVKGSILEGMLSIARTQDIRVIKETYDMVRFATLLQVS